jgi:hypothetical protein
VSASTGHVVAEIDGMISDVQRCGGRIWTSPRPRGVCRCDLPATPPNSICATCGGSWWECCGRADDEPHAASCHTRQNDTGVFVAAFDKWAAR